MEFWRFPHASGMALQLPTSANFFRDHSTGSRRLCAQMSLLDILCSSSSEGEVVGSGDLHQNHDVAAGGCKRARSPEPVMTVKQQRGVGQDSCSWASLLREAYAAIKSQKGQQKKTLTIASVCSGLGTHNKSFQDCCCCYTCQTRTCRKGCDDFFWACLANKKQL